MVIIKPFSCLSPEPFLLSLSRIKFSSVTSAAVWHKSHTKWRSKRGFGNLISANNVTQNALMYSIRFTFTTMQHNMYGITFTFILMWQNIYSITFTLRNWHLQLQLNLNGEMFTSTPLPRLVAHKSFFTLNTVTCSFKFCKFSLLFSMPLLIFSLPTNLLEFCMKPNAKILGSSS